MNPSQGPTAGIVQVNAKALVKVNVQVCLRSSTWQNMAQVTGPEEGSLKLSLKLPYGVCGVKDVVGA
ncbi:uncharacterized protein CIMG_13599 [Coccidioides immitis RS]|uniref:Uncharacterized protein n=1 Tax=Coccidioides immitis (strain RS) TaxID=246410 RepID=J3K212_COCIM|nr:uncharacterized protein CIMG_13599 [Coccidioides immitis RS]EAS28083.3 hypothetical protein CIMG_13599 [Coccidioides immitis RS]TPX20742.1 hypothetical protein DIZ76_016637 [Coccidioides immitis]